MKSFVKVLNMLLLFAGVALTVLAQPTASGTNITNTASATFVDSNGANRSTQSNTVTTIVQTVYYINVEPDSDGTNNIEPGSAGGTVDPGTVSDNDFASNAFASNDLDVASGDDAVLNYSVENLSNKAVEVSLSVAQATSDDYNLSDIKIYIDLNDDGIRDANELYFDGTSNSFPNIASFPNNRLSLPISDGTAGSGTDFYDVYVVGTVPSGQDGNDIALLDLQVSNFTGVSDGTYTPTANANELFENNNLGRVEVNEIVLIGLAKSASTPSNNGNGTWTVDFTFNLKNYGNVALNNVNVTDDLASIFASAASYAVTALSTTGNLTANSVANVNGGSTSLLVPASSSLARAGEPNDTASISMTITITPSTTAGAATTFSFNNSATASGQSPDGTTDTDVSFNGTATDDGDNDPNDDSSATPISLTETPVIGVAKQAGTVVDNNNGTFTVPFTLKVENMGNMNLHDVQVTDILDDEFGSYVATIGAVDSAGKYTVTGLTVSDSTTAPAITANPNFDGDNDTGDAGLLTVAATSVLEVGQSISISFNLTFYPDFANSPFTNQATGSGDLPRNADGVADGDTTDLSDDGADPNDGVGDDGDNDPTDANEDEPSSIVVPSDTTIGVAKRVDPGFGTTGYTDNGDGTFTTRFLINVENLGNVDLHDVQVTESLTAEFGTFVALLADVDTLGEYTVSNLSISSNVSNALSVNAGFNGSADSNLLDVSAGGHIKPGETLSFSFELTFYPNFANSPFSNQVNASGDHPSNNDGNLDSDTTDTSDNGTDPDPDGDNNPDEAGENDETPVSPSFSSSIGIAKQAGTIVDNNNGSFTVPFTFNVENLGNVDLHDVQVTDNLSSKFGSFVATVGAVDSAGEYTVTGLSITTNVANAVSATTIGSGAGQFNGAGANTGLLNVAAGGYLKPTETLTLSFNLTFYPDFANSPFSNQASASGDHPINNDGNLDGDTTDTSDNGTNPDPDGDNNPDEAGENDETPVTIVENAVIGVAKQAGLIFDNTNGTFSLPFTITVENLGNLDLHDVQITEDLSAEFGSYVATTGLVNSKAKYTVSSLSISSNVSNPLTAATIGSGAGNFNGSGANTGLLNVTAGGYMQPGETLVLSFILTFYPDFANSPFSNQVTASGDKPVNDNGSATGDTTDTSDNGTNPDPDGDNNPDEAGENDETPVSPSFSPSIGLAKSASISNFDADSNPATEGPFEVTFSFNLANLGNIDLENIKMTDVLAGALPKFGTLEPTSSVANLGTGEYQIVSISATGVNENTSFDGDSAGNTDVLVISAGSGTSSLVVGATATVTLVIRVHDTGSYSNTATVTADGVNGTAVSDISDSGTDPKGTGGDGDNNPGEANEDDATPVVISSSNLALQKYQIICDDADCIGENVATNSVQTNLNIQTVDVSDGSLNDNFIAYTITAENTGAGAVTAWVFDKVPSPTILVASAQNTSGLLCSSSTQTSVPDPVTAAAALTSFKASFSACSGFGSFSGVTWVAMDYSSATTISGGSTETMRFVVQVP